MQAQTYHAICKARDFTCAMAFLGHPHSKLTCIGVMLPGRLLQTQDHCKLVDCGGGPTNYRSRIDSANTQQDLWANLS